MNTAPAPSFGRLALSALGHLRQGTLGERIQHRVSMRRRRRREAWWNAQDPSGSFVVPTPGGRIRLYFDSVLCREIYCGDFERAELDFVARFLRPADTFIDVGANIGLFTILAATRVAPGGRVYCFEPVSKTFKRLTDNVALNALPSVELINAALSDHAGSAQIVVSTDGHDAWNSFGRPTIGDAVSSEAVSCRTWDAFSREHELSGKVALMKIDVEGWEDHVLAGGRDFFSRADAPTLMVEFTEQAARNAGTTCQHLYDQLSDLGYTIYTYDARTRRLKPDARRDYYDYLNVVATKTPRAAGYRLAEPQTAGSMP